MPSHRGKWEPRITYADAQERFPEAFACFAAQLPDYQVAIAFPQQATLDFAVTRGGWLRVRLSFLSRGNWAWAATARWEPKHQIWILFSEGVKARPYKEPDLEVSVRVIPALDKLE